MTLPRKIFLTFYWAAAAALCFLVYKQELYLPVKNTLDGMLRGGASLGYGVVSLAAFWFLFMGKDYIWSACLYVVDMSLGISKYSSHKRSLMRRAMSLERRGKHNEAGLLYEEVDELRKAGECYLAAHKHESAARVFEFIGEHKRSAKLYEKAGLYEKAVAIYHRINDEVGARQLHIRSAEKALQEDRKRAAVEHFIEGDQLMRAAEILLEMGNLEEAGKVFIKGGFFDRGASCLKELVDEINAALEAGKAPPGGMIKANSLRLKAAEAMEKSGSVGEAAAMYEQAGKHEKAGELYSEAGMHVAATEAFLKAGHTDSARDSMRRSGNVEQLKEFNAIEAMEKGEYDKAAKSFLEMGDLERAMEAYRRGKNPLGMGDVYEKQQRFVSAAEQYSLGGDLKRAAQMYEKGSDYKQAAELYREVGDIINAMSCLEQEGDFYGVGVLYAERGERTKAIAALQRVRSGHPNYAEACARLGSLFSEEKQYDQSSKYFEIALDKNLRTGSLLENYYRHGRSLEEENKLAQAMEVYRRVMEKNYGYEDAAERYNRLRTENPHLMNRAGGDGPSSFGFGGSPSSGTGQQPVVDQTAPATQQRPTGRQPVPSSRQPTGDSTLNQQVTAAPTSPGPITHTGTSPGFVPSGSSGMIDTFGGAITESGMPTQVIGGDAGFSGNGNDRYELLEEIGRGGMGVVYKARDTTLDRVVALKMLPNAIVSESQDDYLNFIREARTIAKLQHSHIVTIFDIGRRGDRYYFSMEYVGGSSLRRRIAERGQLPLPEAMRIANEIAHGLEYAHDNAIIHRDVKPGNILLTDKNETKIVDFGLAKIVGDAPQGAEGPASLTGGFMKGTPHYMSPEQIRGERLDNRTDIYAFGLTLFYMLTGQNVFDAFDCRSPMEVVEHQLKTDLPSPLKFRPELPPEIELVYYSCIEKDREGRLASMRDARQQLEAVPVL